MELAMSVCMSGSPILPLLTFTIETFSTSIFYFFYSRIHDIEAKYYADGEDAYNMRKYFVDE